MFSHAESVVRHAYSPGKPDDYGQVTLGYIDEMWSGVAFAPGRSDEPFRSGGTRMETTATLYDPAGRPVHPLDEFTVRGVRYQVDGDAAGVWVNPFTGWAPGSTIALKRVTGG